MNSTCSGANQSGSRPLRTRPRDASGQSMGHNVLLWPIQQAKLQCFGLCCLKTTLFKPDSISESGPQRIPEVLSFLQPVRKYFGLHRSSIDKVLVHVPKQSLSSTLHGPGLQLHIIHPSESTTSIMTKGCTHGSVGGAARHPSCR